MDHISQLDNRPFAETSEARSFLICNLLRETPRRPNPEIIFDVADGKGWRTPHSA